MSAVQPLDRPAGSQHLLEWPSTEKDAVANAVYPKRNGNFPSDAVASVLVPFRFLLADTSALEDIEKQLPALVYDDRDPAGACPHPFVLGGGILNPTDKNISARTWCQNLDITVTPRTEAAANAMATWDPLATRVCLDDGALSGLGTDTGLPVVVIGIVFVTDSQPPTVFDVDVQIRVRHTTER